MNALLHIARLEKRIGARELFALDDFALEHATAYVLTGVNGAGKSTLLRVLSGLEPAYATGLSFQGQALSLTPYPALMRREVLYVHQHPILFSSSVEANVGFGLTARRVAKAAIAQRVAAAMEWAGIAQLRERDPRTLSGGEKQRVALARATVLEPALLLLDEPTANLDGAAREQVIALIATLTESGATLVMACHDRDLIGVTGVRRLKLRDGRIVHR